MIWDLIYNYDPAPNLRNVLIRRNTSQTNYHLRNSETDLTLTLFCQSNKIYDMNTKLILNHEYKKLPSAKNILGIFAKLNFVIVLLAAQVNRKIESDIEFSGGH